MGRYIVWQPEAGQTEADGAKVSAHSPQAAAEEWADHDDFASTEFRIVGGQSATVMVRDIDSGQAHEWIVSGESLRQYTARLRIPLTPALKAALDEIAHLRTALRFYAHGYHFALDEGEEFDTVGGEPQNWLCSGREDSSTMIEDGTVAARALQGVPADWADGGGEDCTPQPIDGERSFDAQRWS